MHAVEQQVDEERGACLPALAPEHARQRGVMADELALAVSGDPADPPCRCGLRIRALKKAGNSGASFRTNRALMSSPNTPMAHRSNCNATGTSSRMHDELPSSRGA